VQFGRHGSRLENNIEIKLKEIGVGGCDWINVAKDSGDVLVKKVLKIRLQNLTESF